MKKMIILLALLLCACSGIKQVPVQSVEKIVYRDSLIYLKDTLHIQVPVEVIKEVIPAIDTSYIKTSIAESTAYLDTTQRKLVHTLKQRRLLQRQLNILIE